MNQIHYKKLLLYIKHNLKEIEWHLFHFTLRAPMTYWVEYFGFDWNYQMKILIALAMDYE